MCEFNVLLNEKLSLKTCFYAEKQKKTMLLKSVLGEIKEIKNCTITEVDINQC